ncbi:outer membrane beta-barrel protein [Cyclobacterium roseum]|uniref:outer membrane beta-barrel protein n=1 Tax=Cyclobacterium roseum TaxID=2666137 RepID=UPI00139074FA|nr:outer membrane beta-barrel protein [Cyclobacterium roseum]
MKEQFDKKLVEKIKASFSTYEEPFDPAEWEKFSNAYFRPKKKGWMVFWPFLGAGIAASLLFFFIYYPEQEKIDEKVRALTDTISIENPAFSEKDNLATQDSGKFRELEGIPGNSINSGNLEESLTLQDREPHNYETGTNRLPSEQVPEVKVAGRNFWATALSETWDGFQKAVTQKIDSNFLSGETVDPIGMTSLSETDAERMIEQWKAEEKDAESQTGSNESRAFKVGLMVSPQSNSNPVSGMNLGAGLMSEISLSRKLKLDVGLAYASQSVSQQSLQPLAQETASPSFDMRANSNIVDTDYQLNFASLDIPINLKYKVFDRKQTGIYLITGLSSMVYLEQNTVETYEAQSLFSANSLSGTLEYAPNTQKFSNVITPEAGNRGADLAGLLNISFGYEYQLSDEFYFSLEPFYKVPLSNLTFADQQFSIGGVNLRMNFNLKNK